eukprot:Lithocolla_globosa_v1_NODE_4832_length_1354_cov_257.333077.p1 type:complete len:239 gc:universal NODE_4832_length_1354_cov_257.333077:1277-561(-)
MEDDDGLVWNLGYGANMTVKSMNKRKIYPKQVMAGKIKDWSLVFNHPGIPFLEPAFGNVIPVEGGQVHGVLHQITRKELVFLQQTEGGGGVAPGYQLVDVTAETSAGTKVPCVVLSTNRLTLEGLKPSQRYLNLLINGGEANQVDPHYLEYLKTIPVTTLYLPLRVLFAIPFFVVFSQPWGICLFVLYLLGGYFWCRSVISWLIYLQTMQMWFFYRLFSLRFCRGTPERFPIYEPKSK